MILTIPSGSYKTEAEEEERRKEAENEEAGHGYCYYRRRKHRGKWYTVVNDEPIGLH